MTTPTVPPADLTPSGPRPRRRLRRTVAVLAAGGLLATVVGVSVTSVSGATASTQALTARGFGNQPWGQGAGGSNPWAQSGSGGGPSSGSGGSGSGSSGSGSSSTGSVDSTGATAAQEKGVALIDTVLTDGEAAGTGIVLTSDGEVLTNYHVVEGSTSITVTIASTGDTYTATVVGADSSKDVALLKLEDASGLTAATIDDDTLAVGDDVTAVGNAGGTGTLTAAAGTVTDLSSSITTASEGSVQGETLTNVIETDADVVAGDSGGPLVDSQGEVVGIDTAASSGQEIDGYAIPIQTALAIVTQIRAGDETSAVRIGPAAFLGVELAATGQVDTSGATIAGVVDGDAADDAGLVAGDTVTGVGSTEVDDASDLTAAMAKLQPGDRVTLTWTTSSGQDESAKVTIGSSPVN